MRNFRAPTGVHIERPDGSRGIALVDIEAVKDSDGNIIGAVNCFQDITERKGAEEREKILAREVDHRAKNLLALVQAAAQLTHARTVKDFKAAIQGRLQALSNAHSLPAQSRCDWSARLSKKDLRVNYSSIGILTGSTVK